MMTKVSEEEYYQVIYTSHVQRTEFTTEHIGQAGQALGFTRRIARGNGKDVEQYYFLDKPY